MNAVYPLFREALVTSVEDPEELGRVQLRVLPELSEHDEADLPWCFPESTGIHGKSFGMPQVGQAVSCIVWTKLWCEITYLPMVIRKPKEHPFQDWMDNQRSMIDDMANDPEEKDLVVNQYADDFSEYHDTANNEHGFLHPSGTYVTIDKDGTAFMKGVKELHVHDGDGNFEAIIDFTSGDITLTTKGKQEKTVEGDLTETVKGKAETTIEGDATQTYKGKQSLEVGGDSEQTYKGKWSVSVTGDASIESKGAVNIKATSSCKVEASSEVNIKAPQCVIDSQILNFKGTKSQGTVPPSGSGVLCGIPACICSGAPHVG